MHPFWADIDVFLSQMENQKTGRERLQEKKAAAKAYAKKKRKNREMKREIYPENHGLLAVLFDKGIGFCAVRKIFLINWIMQPLMSWY